MSDYGSIIDLVSNVGAVGFVFLLVWRTFNFTIPKMVKSFELSLKDARQNFRDTLSQQRDDFRDMLREHREFITRE